MSDATSAGAATAASAVAAPVATALGKTPMKGYEGDAERFAVVWFCEEEGEKFDLWTGHYATREDAEKRITKSWKDKAEVRSWKEFEPQVRS